MTITSNDIIEAAKTLRSEGVSLDKITNTAIREKLNGGSFATITPVLRAWKQEELKPMIAVSEKFPEQIRTAMDMAMGGLWHSIRDWMEQIIKSRVEVGLADFKTEQMELLADQQRLEGENQVLRENVQKLERDLNDLSSDLQDSRNTHTKNFEKFKFTEMEVGRLDKERLEALKNLETLKATKDMEALKAFQEQTALKETLKHQEGEISKLRSSVSAYELEIKDFKKLKAEMVVTLEKLSSLETGIAKSNEQLQYMKHHDKTREERMTELLKALETSQAEMLKAKEEAAELRGKCRAIEGDIKPPPGKKHT